MKLQNLLNFHFSIKYLTTSSYFLLLLLLASSCSRGLYIPKSGHTLQMTEKNDLQIAGTVCNVNGSGFYNAEIAYSPINRLAVAAKLYNLSNGTDSDNITEPTTPFFNEVEDVEKGFLLEGAIGTYHFINFGKKTKLTDSLQVKEGLLLDLYTGFGQGNNRVEYPTLQGSFDFDYKKYYLQGGVSFIKNRPDGKFMSVGYNLRFNLVDYDKGLVRGDIGVQGVQAIRIIDNSEPFTTAESTFSLKAGTSEFQFLINFSQMSQLNGFTMDHANFILNGGVLLNIRSILDNRTTKSKKSSTTKKKTSKQKTVNKKNAALKKKKAKKKRKRKR